MKKTFTVLTVIALLLTFGAFALGSSESEDATIDQGSSTAADNTATDNTLGNYQVEIKSSRIAQDYEGKPVIIVTYGFTNVSNDTATSFMVALDATAYQNGVGLNESYILDDTANYTADNHSKEIKKGASIDVEVAYELNDTATDVVVEVSELFSFDDKTLTKTFAIK